MHADVHRRLGRCGRPAESLLSLRLDASQIFGVGNVYRPSKRLFERNQVINGHHSNITPPVQVFDDLDFSIELENFPI